jgi:uncharacterized RDD family membrane protein YckC
MPTPAMVDRNGRAAGFWRRYAAWSLDAAIVAVPVWLLSAGAWPAHVAALRATVTPMLNLIAQRLADTLLQGGDPLQLARQLDADGQLHRAMDAALAQTRALLAMPLLWFVVLGAIYWLSFEASRWQATPGKRVLHLRVTGLAGEKPRLPSVMLRHGAGTLSWLTLNLGHALAAWTPQKRALHDYVAGTRVIVDGDDAPGLPAWAKGWLLLQVVAALLFCAWLYLSMLGALRSSIDSALY